MTHQNHQTNGASLEDCHTNFFALTDLCGIKWRKYLIGERPNASGEPLDDPVLRSYARCLECEILCVWRRVAAPKQEQDPNNTISYDIVTSHTHPPLSLTAAKELWIFWYGDEPDLTGLLDQELLQTSGSDSGAWESGLSYECRSLLFKALHNLIERCLLSKDIVRLGKWFVQPCTTNDQIFGQSSQNLSFSFTFFVHGDTVCASIDLREHPAVRPLTPEYLSEASSAAAAVIAAAAVASSSSTPQQSSIINNNNNTSTNNINNNNNSNNDIKPKPVILAPFGMAATLTGDSYRTIDPATDKLLKDWCSFYPLCNKDNSDLPPIVEVISGGVKMRYPSKYVLVTDLDEKTDGNNSINPTNNLLNNNDSTTTTLPSSISSPLHAINNQTSHQQQQNQSNNTISQTTTSVSAVVAAVAQVATTTNNNNNTINGLKNNLPIISTTKHNFESKTLTIYETFINNNNLGNIQNTHAIQTVSTEIPERVWQDCIMNPVATTLSTLNINTIDSKIGLTNNNNNNETSGNLDVNEQQQHHQNCTSNNNNNNTDTKNIWDYADPTQKFTCICIRCNKKQSGGNRSSSSSSSSGKISSSISSGSGGSGGGSSSGGSNNRSDRNLRFNRIPFHKRFSINNNNFIDGGKKYLSTTTTIGNNHNNHHYNQNYHQQQHHHQIVQQQQHHLLQKQQLHQQQQQQLNNNQQIKMKFDEKFNNNNNNNFNIAAAASSSSPAMIDTSLQSQRSVNPETPHGGGSSYSRNSIGDSMPVPSVGSPGSAIMSPHPNSQLSQPTSVPPAELLPVISPRGPTSVPSMQPPTPLDNLDKNTPAPTPTDQHDNKSITASPYIQPTPSVEPPPSVDNIINNNPGSCTGGNNGGIQQSTCNYNNSIINPMSVPGVKKFEPHTPLNSVEQQQQQTQHQQNQQQQSRSNSAAGMHHALGFGINGNNNTNSNINSSTAFYQLFKRPHLSTKDFENNMDDDSYPQLLYDYSTLNAWLDLPVKRFRPNEVKPHRKINHKNVYNSHTHSQPAPMPSPTTLSCLGYNNISNDFQIKKEIHNSDYDSGNENDNILTDMKRKTGLITCNVGGVNNVGNVGNAVGGGQMNESGKNSKNSLTGNLYTEQGLQVSPRDLDDLFDNPDDMSADNSAGDNSGENSNDETSLQVHTPPDSDKSNGCGIEDIKRSLNSNNNNNPNTSILRPEELSKMFPTPPSHEHHPNSSPMSGGGMNDIQMTDLNDNTGICGSIINNNGGNNNNNIITKIKQDIYTDLGSPIDEPIEDWSYVYLPPTLTKFVGSSKYAPLTNLPSQLMPQLTIPPNTFYKPSWLQPQRPQQQQQQQQNQQQNQQQQQHNQDQLQLQPLQQPRTPLSNLSVHPISRQGANTPNSMIGGNVGGLHNSIDNSGKLTPIHQQSAANPMLVNQLNYRPATPSMLRQTMSPISPAAQQFLQNSPMNHMNRRTPIHPPPPYELAVSSPATSTSSYLNKQFNSQEPDTPCSQNGNNGIGNQQLRSPEANSLLVNVLLYDTALNIFRDHNFDSCTLCVCNATQQCVGNIRGSDSGLYVALPGTSFNPAQTNGNNNNSMKMLTGGGGMNSGGNGMMRNLSAFGIDSPSCGPNSVSGNSSSGNNNGTNQHLTGYIDEDQILCSCGFSAVVNRRLAHGSGLFYEDEMDITGMAEDPVKYKKKSIYSLLLNGLSSSSSSDNQQIITKIDTDLPQIIMDLLRDQCTIMQTSISSIQKALNRCRRKKPPTLADLDNVLNILEFTDANDVISLAIEQGRQFYDNNSMMNHNNGNMMMMLNHHNNNNHRMEIDSYRPQKSNITVHKWPYVLANGTRNNQDIVRIMKSMQPLLQNIHSKCRPRMREATYTVQGPLTWRQFHRLAGRGTGQCEPQPIPSLIVGHEKDWLSVAPYAIHYWDKLLLEPYSYSRDVVYLVIAPENDYIVNKTKTYFKELSTTYEMCKLGRHTPIKGWDGILQVGPKTTKYSVGTNNNSGNNNNENSTIEDWYQSIGDTKLSDRIRMYANAFQNALAPYLQRVPNDKSLLDPPESEKNSNQNHHHKDRPIPSPMPPPNTPDPSQPISSSSSSSTSSSSAAVGGGGIQSTTTSGSVTGSISSDKAPSTPKSESEQDRDLLNNSSSANSQTSDLLRRPDDDINPPVIVLYVVEPFTAGSDSDDLQRIACLSLLRCYSDLLNTLPDSVRCNINLQIVSLESILELGRNRTRLKFSDEMKSFALSVFSQCRRFLTHTNTAKSLTGFGTAANMEIFLKNKDEKNKIPYKMYTPPYILAPVHEKSEKSDSFRTKSIEQQYSVMYCNYCISEDQSWLLATATDDRGELLETITINIDIPNRSRRKRAPARRMGLKKLMDFMLGIISQTVIPWRLVVGRIGRIGHGELKSWSWLLSKTNLQKASRQLKDLCKQCSLMHPNAVPSILSACVVTLEPDSKLKVMPDQFTPDERFSQVSMHNPLSTPQDVTCTHILVFPTSAVCQSFQKAFNELNENEVFEGDNFVFDFEDEGQDQELGDLQFLNWDQIPLQQNSPERNSPHGSPSRIEDNRDRNSPNGNLFNSNRNMLDAQDMEEVGIVLQQPLAVGYYVSTAPTGRMPSWFWSSCPHLENVCPVFLKTALHLHVSSIQQNSDVDVLTQSHSSANDHPLDSTLTADVLRYVLEGYNVLSWLAMDSNTRDRLSCLPIHVQILMQLYHMTTALP